METDKNRLEQDIQIRTLTQRVRELEGQLEDKEGSLALRFEELASLTRLMEQQRKDLESLKRFSPWLRVFQRLESEPRFPVTPWYTRWFRRTQQRIPKRAVSRIAESSFFDSDWYLAQYPELSGNRLARSNPALHYLKVGGFQGFDPGPQFDSAWYLQQYPDVKVIAVNPLLHYLLHGADEGRKIRPHQAS